MNHQLQNLNKSSNLSNMESVFELGLCHNLELQNFPRCRTEHCFAESNIFQYFDILFDRTSNRISKNIEKVRIRFDIPGKFRIFTHIRKPTTNELLNSN